MKIKIDITKNVNHQFHDYIGGEKLSNGFIINPEFGTNRAKSIYLEFPGNLELYHFGSTQFKEPIEMHTSNPVDSKWLLIHMNLSRFSQKKKVVKWEVADHHLVKVVFRGHTDHQVWKCIQ